MGIQDSAEDSVSEACEQVSYTELSPSLLRGEERGQNKAGLSPRESGAVGGSPRQNTMEDSFSEQKHRSGQASIQSVSQAVRLFEPQVPERQVLSLRHTHVLGNF